ncbi:MAG: allantoinase AllB [Nocardioides sp.]
MPTPDLVIEAPRAVVDGRERACAVVVGGGRIVEIEEYGARREATETVRLDDDVVLLPGLVDTHVHCNDPGRAHWEGFEHATRAAAAGGVTTIVDMPLNSLPPTVDVAALAAKREAAARSFVDVGFWGGAVPTNIGDLRPLWDDGVFGFKCFLVDSGVGEFPALDEAGLLRAAEQVASFGGLLVVHAEDADAVRPAPSGLDYAGFAGSRPPEAEVAAIEAVVAASKSTGCRVHVVHLAAAAALPVVRAAREAGVPITAETCPHYLSLTGADAPDGDASFKCCPPLRDDANRDGLWAGLREGTISMVVSDHSPCPADLKATGPHGLADAWGGISSLQLGLAVTWTEARRRGHTLADVVGWMATAPAHRVGLSHKGRIVEGAAADLCVLAPDETFVVDPSLLHHRHPVTPYAGRTLTGVVRRTWLAGLPLDLEAPPRGRLITREGAR